MGVCPVRLPPCSFLCCRSNRPPTSLNSSQESPPQTNCIVFCCSPLLRAASHRAILVSVRPDLGRVNLEMATALIRCSLKADVRSGRVTGFDGNHLVCLKFKSKIEVLKIRPLMGEGLVNSMCVLCIFSMCQSIG